MKSILLQAARVRAPLHVCKQPEFHSSLVHFYRSYLHQKLEPTKNAVDGMEWALKLAPFDDSVRLILANRQIQEARFAEAIKTLKPLA